MKTKNLILISFFAAITSVLSYVKIPLPFTPVPLTGQTLGVMLTGTILGSRAGSISLIIYLLLGMIGLPVFSGGTSGIGILSGPTGGFLWSFPISAFVIGKLSERSTNLKWLFLANLLGGVVVVHFLGLIQFSFVLKRPIIEAFTLATLPFLPGDILKAFLSALAGKKIGIAMGGSPNGNSHKDI